MAERDDLAKLLFTTDNSRMKDPEGEWLAAEPQHRAYVYNMADALITAGYCRPRERDELMLDNMGPSTQGGFEIKTHAGGPETAQTLLFIADSMRSMLDEHEAPNYLEMEVKASDGKRYIMNLQRAGKVTPHSARLAAETEVAKATALIRDLADPEDCHFDHHGGCQAHGYLSLESGEACPQREAKDWVQAQEEKQ